MSGEPKTLTPGLEARLTVTQVNALVIAIKECWEFAHGHGFGPHREGKAAMEALRAAFPFSFGVPVVARDEAAELRAALGATVDAINGALIYHGHVISTPVMRELSKASNEADALLRRLAGGESER